MIWNIQLFGGLAAHGTQGRVRRFRTQKSASLLAFLAFHSSPQPRESLIDLLWPDSEMEVGRHNLSMALSFLRHQLEPPGVPPGTVIVADRFSVRLNPAAVVVDALEFEKGLRKANQPDLPGSERLAVLLEVSERYQGTLLPGFYDEWIAPQALRLEGQYVEVLARLVDLLLAEDKHVIALMYAQRAATADPLSELATRSLLRALAASGQNSEAVKAFRSLEARLLENLGTAPSAELKRFVAELEKGGDPIVGTNGAQDVKKARHLQEPTPVEPDAEWMPSHNRLIGAEFLLRTTTRFFGRSEEVDRLSQMLSSPRSRLVTLTGPGGTGKTRLALEVAAQVVESKGCAGTTAAFVSLGSLSDPERIFEAILRSLGVPTSSDTESFDQLVRVLQGRRSTLLVLDNFEQLAQTGALRLRNLLARTESVRLLVTSRQRLLVEGEREYRLAPLPTADGTHVPEELLLVPSVAMFVDRAQAVLPDFQLTARNSSEVAKLCEMVDGLPLAIELAAARISTLSPSRILQQVQVDRLDFLATRRRDAISRHKTLRTTLDWSYSLLPESAQEFLAGVSVFRGGWTLAAAATVCAMSECGALELLTLLLDNSLIRVVDEEHGMRFTILETIREYGWEKLVESGRDDDVRSRHRDYFAGLADQADRELSGSSQVLWINLLQAEHDNLCFALEFEDGLRIAGSLWRFWEVRGYLSLGRQYLARALKPGESRAPTAVRARALVGAGALAIGQGDYEKARTLLLQSLQDYERLEDGVGIALANDALGRLAAAQGDFGTSADFCEMGLALRRKLQDRSGTATSLQHLALARLPLDGVEAVRPLLEESLALRQEIGDRRGIASLLSSLSHAAFAQGDYDAAEKHAGDSLTIRQELGDKSGTADSLDKLASLSVSRHQNDRARELFERSLAIRRDIGDRDGMAHALYGQGVLAQADQDYESANRLALKSLEILRETGGTFLIHVLGLIGHVSRESGDYDRANAFYQESLALRVGRGDAFSIALSLEDLACLAWQEGRPGRAGRLLGAAEAICLNIGWPVPAGSEQDYDRTRKGVKEELGRDAFDAALQDGRDMTLERSVLYAVERKAVTGRVSDIDRPLMALGGEKEADA